MNYCISKLYNTKRKHLFTLDEHKSIYLMGEHFKEDIRLKTMQDIVGGYIERYPDPVTIFWDTSPISCPEDIDQYDIIVNEEGMIRDYPYNGLMNELFDVDVWGTVILLEGGLK